MYVYESYVNMCICRYVFELYTHVCVYIYIYIYVHMYLQPSEFMADINAVIVKVNIATFCTHIF